ncbi:aspartyl-phosphate phosphatase Spo0E family protein (plasmid) [Clostridium perfringens]|jgi:hypothetical protein|nr:MULTISPECIES: aspartyl-phosphate phosphatase Spo0E family protein [Clostridium]MDJ8959754.1 aspartyl-phosphate phosphatase Spo0E family protein [Clostridium perfringens]MDM0789972.1 aspartyl-phosphate phosphatase Spo0E family protein [Clostridium perfringens]MDU4427633.1 aspartyl-phosphate phosphatase Spo0E family protein [Clostridium sp.]MDU7458758.1 aspartyl-phosphate phosphatase Spo0E family protein [Clostridium perfringens]MDU7726978.1 aspartyl-phosphate phosphatase Spo0E family protein
MEKLRDKLHEAIDKYGLDYDKVIEVDKRLHEDIIKKQRCILGGKENA